MGGRREQRATQGKGFPHVTEAVDQKRQGTVTYLANENIN